MSKLLGGLLGASQRDIDALISRLEAVCLHPGVDTRLTAHIITQAREKSRLLGLDPEDSTKRELHHALVGKARQHDELLRRTLSINESTPPAKVAESVASKLQPLVGKDTVFCMQPAAVKHILKAVPPKKIMRKLKFRSIDSVLKREDPRLVYALANILEDKTWHSQVNARLKRLQSKDVHEHPIGIIAMPKTWIEKLKDTKFDGVVEPVAEIGAILLLPTVPSRVAGSVLLTAALTLHAAQQLVVQSLPYRSQSMMIAREKLLPEIAAGLTQALDPIHGLQPSWTAVFRLLAARDVGDTPEFEFILQDLSWEDTETKLSSLHPDLDFWVGTHYLGYRADPRPVSMHVIDVTASLVLERDFGEHVVSHLQNSLWNELELRYLQQEKLEQALLNQLMFSQEVVL